jgi:hypothetical protein
MPWRQSLGTKLAPEKKKPQRAPGLGVGFKKRPLKCSGQNTVAPTVIIVRDSRMTIARWPSRDYFVFQQSVCVLGGVVMAGGRSPAFNSFTCPNCNALYQVVKVEAGPETDDREITCRACGGPLTAREGNFVLKYFLLRKGIRSRRKA